MPKKYILKKKQYSAILRLLSEAAKFRTTTFKSSVLERSLSIDRTARSFSLGSVMVERRQVFIRLSAEKLRSHVPELTANAQS